MTATKITARLSSVLALTAAFGALALVSACDEGVDNLSPEHAAVLADYEAQLDAEFEAEPAQPVTEGASVQAPAGPGQAPETVIVNTASRVSRVNLLNDDDLITIFNKKRGYVTCDGDELSYAVTMYNTDNYLWQVHDDGGQLYFERIDATGQSGMFLKMRSSAAGYEVYCGEITGTGSQARWSAAAPGYYTTGSWVRPVDGQIEHASNGQCLTAPSSGKGGNGDTCGNDTNELFNFTIWDNIAPDCVDGVCSCSTDLDCAFDGNPNYVCINESYCGLSI